MPPIQPAQPAQSAVWADAPATTCAPTAGDGDATEATCARCASPCADRAGAVGAPSPCIGVCRMQAASGLCVGCLRTLDEIATWRGMADAQRWAVLAELPGRCLAPEPGAPGA